MKDRHFYRTFFSMYFVLVFQNVISLSVNLADNIMLGAYSEVSLSGVAAVNQIQFIYQQLLTAVGDGMVIFCSQYWGKKQLEPVKKIAATAMHTGLVFAAALWYVLRKEPNLKMRISDYFRTDRLLRRDYFKTMVPMLIVQGLWGLNTAMQTVILGHMTARAIAANSAASNLFLMVKSMAVGASSAASVLIGKTIGEGDLKKVHLYARRLQKMFVVIGIVSGVFLYFLRIPVLSFYDLAPETREMANRFLIILSVICVTMSYQMPTNNGIIRGGGNAMFVVRMDLISIWCIVIPLSFFMAFVVKASPVVVVCCLNADQVFKCIPAFLEVNYGKRVKKLTRD